MPDPAFIAALRRLEPARQRAAFAALRGSLQDGHELDAAPYILPFVSDPRDEPHAMLVAGLFALHPEPGPSSVADALRSVKVKTDSDSVELRFRALLSASRAELPIHLRHAVSLIASQGLGLDWGDLYDSLRWWERDAQSAGGMHPKRRWARDFWASSGDDTADPS
jgi:CRISPR system Cascade subunit CasB